MRKITVAALILVAVLVALPAVAIPNIVECSSYVLYATGTLTYTEIANENSPHGVNDQTAATSGTGRCYGLWTSALAYANAGCQTTVQDNFNGTYTYYCWKCNGAIGPVVVDHPIDPIYATHRALDANPGTVISVRNQTYALSAEEEVKFFEVDIQGEDGIIDRVRVDAETGEVTVPAE